MDKYKVLVSIGDLHVFNKAFTVEAESEKHAEDIAYDKAEAETSEFGFDPQCEWKECDFGDWNIQTEETTKL